ncbi:MAG: delta-aminolevulinic acid dehydratase, partial [Deltaproteobacteria bacterium]
MQNFFRGRRLRGSASLRAFVRETHLRPEDLLQPYFVVDTDDSSFCREISSMPGQYQLALPMLEKRVEQAVDKGLRALMLFGLPREKDETGSQAWAENGIVHQAVCRLKKRWSHLLVVTDVCLCEYTSHGHCGLIADAKVENDSTLELLSRTALSHAQAGADIVAPSDMMDGRIGAIRTVLDANGFKELPILSYAVKYASAFYGPFRDAAESA